MASDSAAKTVNGNYGSQTSQMSSQDFDSAAGARPSTTPGAQASNVPTSSSAEGSSNVPKDEVGWYFVEQYYTTLSKSPEKLHVRIHARSIQISNSLIFP